MKNRSALLLLPLLLLIQPACVSLRKSGEANPSSQRVELQKQGIIIEAHYDPRLDGLIPGYKVLTVGVTNQGVETLRLNPLKDRWEIVDAYGKSKKAVNSLRIKDPATWSRLPDQVKRLIDYPVGVSVSYSETIDLFFPGNTDLNSFRSISFYSDANQMQYDVLTDLGQSPASTPVPSPEESDARFKKKKK